MPVGLRSMVHKPHLMIDLETASSHGNAAILSIGAVLFHTGSKIKYYANVDLSDCMRLGLHVSAKTIYWWLEQEKSAQNALLTNKQPLAPALHGMISELVPMADRHLWKDMLVWSWPSSFDLPILRNAFKAINSDVPWHYRQECDMRTLMRIAGMEFKTPQSKGTKHNALDDADTQMEELIFALEDMFYE